MPRHKMLEKICKCQNEIDALYETVCEKILGIERNYKMLRKPHLDKINEIIQNISNFFVTLFVNTSTALSSL